MKQYRTLLSEVLAGDPATDREIEVLYGMARGLSITKIAGELHLAVETVKTYRKRIIAKLEAKNGIHAVVIAIAHGLIDISRVVEDE